jgi:hypothetical protein
MSPPGGVPKRKGSVASFSRLVYSRSSNERISNLTDDIHSALDMLVLSGNNLVQWSST